MNESFQGVSSTSGKYRPDIDGLRALAVIPVVLFHSDFRFFSGGFVGVDIFFVISGYLITNILLSDIHRNEFSIVKFYERRIRRIFPALFAVLLVSSVVALAILTPKELNRYGWDLIATTFFYSNYYSMFGAGYFAPTAESLPLLHMWSLAVEEQFYIVFPVYLYLASRFFRDRIGLVTSGLMLASLLYSIVLVDKNPADAFFSAPVRAWELMLGSMLAIFPRKAAMGRGLAELLSFAGLAAIVLSILCYGNNTPFPGASALPPCIGAALLIYTGSTNTTFAGRLLSTSVFRLPGLISYSLYLWHWPILVFYRMYALPPLSNLENVLLMLSIFAAAWASWKFIEAPFRTKTLLTEPKWLFATSGAVMLASVACGAITILGDGFPNRYPDHIARMLAASNDFDRPVSYLRLNQKNSETGTGPYIGDSNSEVATFAVWGDSHAMAMLPAIDASMAKYGRKGIFIGKPGCPPLMGINRADMNNKRCGDLADKAMVYLNAHPEITHVILVSRWALNALAERYKNEAGDAHYLGGSQTISLSVDENKKVFKHSFEETIAKLSQLKKSIIVVTQVPEIGYDLPEAALRATIFNHDVEFRPRFQEYAARQSFVSSIFEEQRAKYDLTLIHPYKAMCDMDYCQVFDGDVPMYKDDDHITKSYSLKLSHLFDPLFAMPPHKNSKLHHE